MTNKWGIKSPAELKFSTTESFDVIMKAIAEKINARIYEFTPLASLEQDELAEIRAEVYSTGWTITFGKVWSVKPNPVNYGGRD